MFVISITLSDGDIDDLVLKTFIKSPQGYCTELYRNVVKFM